MSILVGPLSSRTMSSYPVSIGTALALESISLGPNEVYDEQREIPNKIDLFNYEEVWINLLTLYRNIFGSVEREQTNSLTPEDVAYTLEQEVDIITDVIRMNSMDKAKVIFYTSNYVGAERKYPNARLRRDSTEKQKSYTRLASQSLSMFYKGRQADENFRHFKLEISTKKRTKALIMTHYAYDLLSWGDFKKLDLLESHTGVVKSRPLWYTKFGTSNQSMIRIPFTIQFLHVFGDSTMFHPHDKKLRDAILEIAERYNWNYATTKDRISLGLSNLKNPYYVQILKEMN